MILHKIEPLQAGYRQCKTPGPQHLAIQENPGLSPDNVEKLEVVQAAFTKRDAIIAESKPIMDELKGKLRKAEEILVKYG